VAGQEGHELHAGTNQHGWPGETGGPAEEEPGRPFGPSGGAGRRSPARRSKVSRG